MIVFLNGQFVAQEQARVSVFDRGFLYGDGLFETLRVANGRPFLWDQHLKRLWAGVEFCKLELPFAPMELREIATELIERNQTRAAVLRLTISRGVGPRGYSPHGAAPATVVMSLHAAPGVDADVPRGWRLATSSIRLTSTEPLSRFKTCNKLPQIVARAEADALGADEALLLGQDGWAVEGTCSNLFWITDRTLLTPPLSSGALPGITRAAVFELCAKLGVSCREANAKPEQLLACEGVFLTLSSLGIVAASHLDKQPLAHSPIADRISAAYSELLISQTQL